MNDKHLDKFIKENLDKISPSMNGDAWSIFEQRLIADEDFDDLSADIHLDQKVKASLASLQPGVSADWPVMYGHLQVIDDRRRTIYTTKIIELAIFCLFFYALNHTPSKVWEREVPVQILPKNAMADVDQKGKTSFSSYSISKAKQSTNHSEFGDLTTSQANKGSVSTYNIGQIDIVEKRANHRLNLGLETVNVNNFKSTIPATEIEHSASNYQSSSSDLVSSGNNIKTTDGINNGDAVDSQISSFDSDQMLTTTQSNLIEGSSPTLVNHSTETVAPQLIAAEFIPAIDLIHPKPESEFALSFPMKRSKMDEKPKWYLSLFVSGDVNQINTPFDKVYSLSSYEKEALNNSIGLDIGRELDKVSVSTGVEYSRREYQPREFKETYGDKKQNYYFVKSLDKISFDVLAIPLKIKYRPFEHKNWALYISAGVAMNLVLNAHYNKTEEIVNQRPSDFSALPSNSRLDQKNFIPGILNGGTVKDNYFATAALGFGIQKKINNKTSFFVEPQYQRFLFSHDIGIGPNKDKIHTASLQIGVKSMFL